MEINEEGKFVPTPMPKLYFEHSCQNLCEAFGVSKKREKQLDRAIEDLMDERKEAGKEFKKVSVETEEILKLAENEQERIYLALSVGRRHPLKRGIDITGMIGSGGIDELIQKLMRDMGRDRDEE